MKKEKLILLTALLASSLKINAQGGTPTNNSAFGGFLGFNVGPNVPLQVRNDFNNQIRFFTITNFLGQTLQKGVLNTDVNKINLQQLPKGVYLITITNKNYTQTDRII